MYIAILAVLLIFTLISFKTKKHKIIYILSMAGLSLLLCFRYGQGPDYFNYNYFYKAFSSFNAAIHNYSGINCEIGFRLLCAFFRSLRLDYTAFIFFISAFQMLMLHRFLTKFSCNKLFSLLLFFPTFYLTYFFSGIRQGITLALFLGFMLAYIEQGKWKKYIVGCLLLSTIHTVALVLLIVPFVLKLSIKTIYIFNIAAFAVGCFLATGWANNIIALIPVIGEKMQPYLENSVSILALGERVISFVLIMVLYSYAEKNDRLNKFMKIYTTGVGLYLLFFPFSLISSRLIIYFKVLEVILIPMLTVKPSRFRRLIVLFFIVLSLLMAVKNLNSYVSQSGYDTALNGFTYPYISVFNKEKIYEYQKVQASFYSIK